MTSRGTVSVVVAGARVWETKMCEVDMPYEFAQRAETLATVAPLTSEHSC